MTERTLNFGTDATDADYQVRDTDATGGDLVVEHLPSGAEFRYNATANQWELVDPLSFGDEAADPSANGVVQRNGTDLKAYSGGGVRNLSNIGSGYETTTVSSNYTTQDEDVIYVDESAGAVTVTLASSDVSTGNEISVVNMTGTNTVTVDTEGAETIDPNGESSKAITEAAWAVGFVADGTNWAASVAGEFESVDTPTIVDSDDGTSYDVGDDLAGGGAVGTSVESESDLTGLSAGEQGYIPPGTTVNISSFWSAPDGVQLDIYGTLRQADGADIGGWMLRALEVSNVTVRLFGTLDGNYANQSTTTTQAFVTNEFGSGNPENVQFYGPGTVTGFEGDGIIKFTNTSRRCVMGGFEVRDWRATALADAFAVWANSPEHCVYRDMVFHGSTFPSFDGSGGASAGDGDIFSGATDEEGLKIINNTMFDTPRRGIQGGTVIAGNRGFNVAAPGLGGDFITVSSSGSLLIGNVGYGTYDDSGDNGIVARHFCTAIGNYMEGFSNNGILVQDNGSGHGTRVIGNECVDNDQGTNSNSNIEYRDADSIGKCLGFGNVSIARNHSPTYGVRVENSFTDSRVEFDSAIDEGPGYGTAAFQDNSPASTTVNEL